MHSAWACSSRADNHSRSSGAGPGSLAMGPAAVILKLGENGCLYVDRDDRASRAGISR